MASIDPFHKKNRRPLRCCHVPSHFSQNEGLGLNPFYFRRSDDCERATSPIESMNKCHLSRYLKKTPHKGFLDKWQIYVLLRLILIV